MLCGYVLPVVLYSEVRQNMSALINLIQNILCLKKSTTTKTDPGGHFVTSPTEGK